MAILFPFDPDALNDFPQVLAQSAPGVYPSLAAWSPRWSALSSVLPSLTDR